MASGEFLQSEKTDGSKRLRRAWQQGRTSISTLREGDAFRGISYEVVAERMPVQLTYDLATMTVNIPANAKDLDILYALHYFLTCVLARNADPTDSGAQNDDAHQLEWKGDLARVGWWMRNNADASELSMRYLEGWRGKVRWFVRKLLCTLHSGHPKNQEIESGIPDTDGCTTQTRRQLLTWIHNLQARIAFGVREIEKSSNLTFDAQQHMQP
ncbi:hypothetical protein HY213_02020 [Candidatus Peregrinibacteria bacterium]|nr:hypothetical protein [Candidatus Peregrinibacteria bacterium]